MFLNVTGSLGGAERVLLTLLRELRRLRPDWQLTVLAGDAGPLIAAIEGLGCEAHVLPLGEKLNALGDWGTVGKAGLLRKIAGALPQAFRYRSALCRTLRELSPDVVQTNGFKMHVLGAMACPKRARLVWHVHDFVSSRTAMKQLLRWFSGRPDTVAAISAAVAKDLLSVLKEPRKIRTIWNSVELAPVKSIAPHEGVKIGLVATFARWKGHDVFLRSLALLPTELPWRGFIVGGEVYRRAGSQWTERELRALANQLGIESRVEFNGFLLDPAPFVGTLDVVVHASTEPEPFGLAIAEAMAEGRAVATSSESIVTDGVDGFVHRRGDAAGLALALERLVRDPELRTRLGAAARQTAEERFQPERMAQEFIALYEAAG